MIMNITSGSTNDRNSSKGMVTSEWFKLLLKPVYRLYVYRMLSEVRLAAIVFPLDDKYIPVVLLPSFSRFDP